MVVTFIQVGVGGAIGAMLRFGLGLAVLRAVGTTAFPIAVLGANIAGSFLMGLCVVWLGRSGLAHLGPLLMTGVLGGFTTFSAFSLEAYTLFERGEAMLAALYVGASVTLSIAGLIAGVMIARGALA